MASRAHRSAGLVRSLTLLWVFVLTSAVILGVAAVTLSTVLSARFEEQVLDDSAGEAALFTSSVVAPVVVRGDELVVRRGALRRLGRAVRAPDDFIGISIWTRRGRLAFSTFPRHRAAIAGKEARETLAARSPRADIRHVSTSRKRPERTTRAVVVWAPLLTPRGRPVGVVEMLLRPTTVDASVASASHTVWVAVATVFGVLWLALVLLVSGASARLSRQNTALETRSRDLLDSTRTLERTLIETIETLNAAVEARDPYTAGHSQRVRRVALAIGRELALPVRQLGVLGTAALFHDVGKIGIPDSILTKAGPLEPAEAAVMREHVTRGAEIVSKVSSFQDAVPAILYHHERWDGLGYPDGLHGEDIPLEAAIIGLADAWDAMTTSRPYASGLSMNDAMIQIRTGRGKQFNPIVVDAFWQVARRRPGDVLPPGAESTVGVAV
jgi:putative nucleotidyltransferase with HDIG domain